MKLAICTQCGAQIEVDETREAGICQYCDAAFITEKAINNFTKSIMGDKKDAGSDHFGRGMTYLKLRRFGDALGEFRTATEKSPECAKYWFYRLYAQLHGFENFYGLMPAADTFSVFRALATEEEVGAYEREFGVRLDGSFEDFAYGCLLSCYSSGVTVAERSLICTLSANKLPCKSPEIARGILEKAAGGSEIKDFLYALEYTAVMSAVAAALGEEATLPPAYFSAVNTVDEEGHLHIFDPRQFLKDGVFEIPAPYRRVIFHSIKGIRRLIVKDNTVLAKRFRYDHKETKRVEIVEIDASCTEEACIRAAITFAEGLLILPEHITSLTAYSHMTYSTEVDRWYQDKEMYLPYDYCILHFKGKATGGLSHSYRDKNILKDEVETKVHKWAYVSDGKAYNISPDDGRLKKYFGEGHGLVPAEEPRAAGCYIATCVYGSYDCPEVWTLRRYRDRTLARTAPGRAFIRVYYTVSPTIVRLFGKYRWFNRLFRRVLDKKVKTLSARGFEGTPYRD